MDCVAVRQALLNARYIYAGDSALIGTNLRHSGGTRARDVEISAVFCAASPLRITQSCGEEIASLSTSSSPHFRVTRQTYTVVSLRDQIKRSLSFSGSDTGGGLYFSTFIKVLFKKQLKLECGPMPNVMAALPSTVNDRIKCKYYTIT